MHGTWDAEPTHKPEDGEEPPVGLYQTLAAFVQERQERQLCGEEPEQDMMKPQLQTQVTTIDLKKALP